METEKHKFHHCKNLNVDIAKIQVCGMVFLGKNYKYFIGCKDDNHKIKPLCKGIQKRVKSYDREPKWMYFY